jgi:hypothetical protein
VSVETADLDHLPNLGQGHLHVRNLCRVLHLDASVHEVPRDVRAPGLHLDVQLPDVETLDRVLLQDALKAAAVAVTRHLHHAAQAVAEVHPLDERGGLRARTGLGQDADQKRRREGGGTLLPKDRGLGSHRVRLKRATEAGFFLLLRLI